MLLFRGASKRPHSVKSAVRRLAVSRFISMAGTDATGVAIGFALYAQTHSATWLSASLMLTVGAGALLSPFGGRAAELIDRRRLMIAAEIAAATVFAALAIVHTPVALLALGLLATAIGTVFGPASGAAIAHVAGEQNLTWASSVIATGANVGKTAGRLAAGALIAAIGVTSVFVLDALTFVASALIIATVHRSFSARQDARAAAALHPTAAPDATVAPGAAPESSDAAAPDVAKGGMRLLAADRKLRLLTATACVSTFATAFTMTAEVPLVFQLGVGALGLGALTASWGGGMIIGSWYAGRALHRGNEATGVLVGRLAMATGVGLIAAAPSLGPMLACYLLGGLGGGFMGVAAQSMIMRSVDDDVRGRLLGAIECCRNTAFGMGVIGAGAAVELLGPRPVYAAVGMTMALGTLPVAALVKRLGGMRPLRPLPAIAA
jgi:predicted MFS family arabinose efflux permease